MEGYTAFGLTLRSALPLPELAPWPAPPETPADVSIRYGEVPRVLDGGIRVNRLCQVGAAGILFDAPGTGRLLVRGGDTILLPQEPEAPPDVLRASVLGSGLGAILHHRGLLPLHASGVAGADGRALLFIGARGAGKSTTAALLVRRGYRLLSDDVCAVEVPAAGDPVVRPGFARQKLWASSLALLGEAPAAWPAVDGRRDKHAYVPSGAFHPAPALLHGVVLLTAGAAPGRHRVPSGEAVPLLLRHTYRKWVSVAVGNGARSLRLCRDVARRVTLWVVEHPRDASEAGRLVEVVEGCFA